MRITRGGMAALTTGIALAATLVTAQTLEARDTVSPRQAAIATCGSDAECEAAWGDAPTEDGITEEDPRWNCLTMGNGVCGPTYVPVTPEQADNLSEGDEGGDFPWESCLIDIDSTTTVVCPDGTVVTS